MMKTAKILFFILFFPFHVFSINDLTICSVFQNEGSYMKEWIDYHKKVGVQHFLLYNNNSTDHFREVLQPYIEEGIVELFERPSIEYNQEGFAFTLQTEVYTDAIQKSRGKTRWLAIIDLDEFIVPVIGNSIVKVLDTYFSKESGICVNWQCYGTSHIWKVPEGKMLEHLVFKMEKDHPNNKYYKSIVRPERVARCSNPHLCDYYPGYRHVNTIHEPIGVETSGVYIDLLRINHYSTRDEWFFNNIKIPRYQKWGMSVDKLIEGAALMNECYDPIILEKL